MTDSRFIHIATNRDAVVEEEFVDMMRVGEKERVGYQLLSCFSKEQFDNICQDVKCKLC